MINIKSPVDIEQMKAAGALSKAALRRAGALVRPGVSTKEIDQVVEGFIRLHGAVPTFKGYGGFPASICSSVNEQIVHGIPSPVTILQEGDIISIDTGATYQGWVGDNAWTFYVGEPSAEWKALCECTRDCLKAAIEQAVPGNHLGDIGAVVQELAEKNGYGVVRDYVGHGVGRVMHEDPEVRNYGRRGRGVRLQAGMVIAIEPMITLGTYRCHTLANGWTVVTDDGQPAAPMRTRLPSPRMAPSFSPRTRGARGARCTGVPRSRHLDRQAPIESMLCWSDAAWTQFWIFGMIFGRCQRVEREEF